MSERFEGRRTPAEQGRYGENLAVQALIAHGYIIVEQNWRCSGGEIDIVAQDDKTWVFVEVKTRQGCTFGAPEEAVTASKRTHLAQSVLMYLADHDLSDVPWRIDVVAIDLAPSGRVQRMAIYRDAIRFDG